MRVHANLPFMGFGSPKRSPAFCCAVCPAVGTDAADSLGTRLSGWRTQKIIAIFNALERPKPPLPRQGRSAVHCLDAIDELRLLVADLQRIG